MRESRELRRDMRDSRGIADWLGALALMAEAGGNYETAARLLGAAEPNEKRPARFSSHGSNPSSSQPGLKPSIALGDERFDRALAKGRSLSRQDAIALALDSVQRHGRALTRSPGSDDGTFRR